MLTALLPACQVSVSEASSDSGPDGAAVSAQSDTKLIGNEPVLKLRRIKRTPNRFLPDEIEKEVEKRQETATAVK